MTRSITNEEAIEKLFAFFKHLTTEWGASSTCTKQEACENVVFAILSMIDGCNTAFPGFLLSPVSEIKDSEDGSLWWRSLPINDQVELHSLYSQHMSSTPKDIDLKPNAPEVTAATLARVYAWAYQANSGPFHACDPNIEARRAVESFKSMLENKTENPNEHS